MTLAISAYSDPKNRVEGTGVGVVLDRPNGDMLTHGYRTSTRGRGAAARVLPKLEKLVERTGPVHAVCDEELSWLFYTIDHSVLETSPENPVYRRAQKGARARLYGVKLKRAVLVGDTISNKRAQLIHVAAKKSGYTERAIRKMLAEYGLVSTSEVTTDIFRTVISKARSKTLASLYNDKVNANHAIQ